MKLIYSIFNSIDQQVSEVRFRVVLDKEDFIVINQFRDDTFSIRDEVDRHYYPEYSESMLRQSEHREFVEIRWDKNNLKPIVNDDEIVGWESEEYRFKKYITDASALDVLNE